MPKVDVLVDHVVFGFQQAESGILAKWKASLIVFEVLFPGN